VIVCWGQGWLSGGGREGQELGETEDAQNQEPCLNPPCWWVVCRMRSLGRRRVRDLFFTESRPAVLGTSGLRALRAQLDLKSPESGLNLRAKEVI
jgi:hypothetical protein